MFTPKEFRANSRALILPHVQVASQLLEIYYERMTPLTVIVLTSVTEIINSLFLILPLAVY